MTTRLSRPPIDLNSFFGRKWLEAITQQSQDVSAIASLQFLLLAIDTALPNARRLLGSSNITLTDGGAGGNVTINISDTGVTAGSYNNITVDAKGRATAGSNVSYARTDLANTFTQDQSVPDEAYGVGWNGSVEVPTKNALYDKIETVIAGASDMDAKRLIHLGY